MAHWQQLLTPRRQATSRPPQAVRSLRYWLATHSTAQLWQQTDADTTPVDQATADGDRVGQLDDASSGFITRAISAPRRPLLGSGNDYGSYVTLDGVEDVLQVVNSRAMFGEIHRREPFTLILVAKFTTEDGVRAVILDSTNASSGSDAVGFNLERTTNNKLKLFVTRGVVGTPALDYTTTANFTTATGWTPIVIRSNGNQVTIKIGSATAETTSYSAAAGSGLASYDLYIGARQGPANYAGLQLGAVYYAASSLTDDEVASLAAYNPARTSQTLAYQSSSFETPLDISHLHTWWDMTDTSRLWQDLAMTVPVASLDRVRVVQDPRSWVSRNAIATDDPRRATYLSGSDAGAYGLSSEHGGRLGGLYFDPTTGYSNYDFADWPWGGAFELFIVAINRDSTHGSHLVQQKNYIVITGSGYGGNPTAVVLHGHAAPNPDDELLYPEDWHLHGYSRQGATWCSYLNGSLRGTLSNSSQFQANGMGKQWANIVGNDWHMHGVIAEIVRFSRVLSGAERETMVGYLTEKHGLS